MWWLLPAAVCAWESVWWLERLSERDRLYKEALAHARRIHKPLLVVGAPDLGPTKGPGAGDIVCDIRPSKCPRSIQCDITKLIPLPNDSVVAFVSCVLEYVDDLPGAMRELRRVAGNRIYNCRVQPWTLTAMLYPGAKRTTE